MLRIGENCLPRANFDDFAEIHDRYPVTDAFNHRHIMRDEQKGDFHRSLQFDNQVDHLRFDRHIQRRHRLVGDNHLGIHRQRAGNADALALTTGKFMRIAVKHRDAESHFLNQFMGARQRLLACGEAIFQQWFNQRFLDFQPWIQAGERILKNHLDILTHPLLLLAPGLQDVIAIKANMAGLRLDQANETATGGRFTAAGFAHQR